MSSPVTGLVLAGGESRRMGREKAWLPWGRLTLIEHVVETLRPVTDEVIVAVKDATKFRHLHATVVEDLVPDAHALGGIYTGLRAASTQRCFVCACDAPFLNMGLLRLLMEQADGYDLVMPRSAVGLEPLHALYARSALPAIEAQLRQRRWDLRALVPLVRARVIEAAVWRPYDSEGRCFLNLNSREEYAACLRRGRRGE